MKISLKGDKHEGTCDHGKDCCPHKVNGVISICSGKAYNNGKQIALIGDEVTHNCPHCGKGEIIDSTSKIYVNGKQACGIGSNVKYEKGDGKIISSTGNING